MRPSKWLLIAAGVIFLVSHAYASNVPLDDPGYDVLRRLEAEGIVESSILTTLPLSRQEIVRLIREAEKNAGSESGFIQQQIEFLKARFRDDIEAKKYIKPLGALSGKYIYSDQDDPAIVYNNDGDIYAKGSNIRAGLSSWAEFGWFSYFINPELRYDEGDTDLILKNGYGVIHVLGLDLEAGKESQWWGPGYHGSLLLSNNAEPFTLVRLSNTNPVLLPWIFKYLGPLRFTAFATMLEEDRDFSHPYLWGMKINFKPLPYFEFGLERTGMLGGEGRPEDLETWWDSFLGKGENEPGEPGDQRAGFDVKLTLPFPWQPVQLYGEAAGEDEAGGLPTKWAYLGGICLPRIASFEQLGFRAEYATTHVPGSPNVWYTSHVYTSGYTYKGRIIGHHMGTDSEDLFFQLSYYLPRPDGRIRVSYDREKHNLSGDPQPVLDQFSGSVRVTVLDGLAVEGTYSHGKWHDAGMLPDVEENTDVVIVSLEYTF